MIHPSHKSENRLRAVTTQALALAPNTPASLFFVDDADGDEVELDVDVEVAVPFVFAVLTKT
jgi:hypothetical protein